MVKKHRYIRFWRLLARTALLIGSMYAADAAQAQIRMPPVNSPGVPGLASPIVPINTPVAAPLPAPVVNQTPRVPANQVNIPNSTPLAVPVTVPLDTQQAGKISVPINLPTNVLPVNADSVAPVNSAVNGTLNSAASASQDQGLLVPARPQEARSLAVRALLRLHRDVVEADSFGEPIVRHEVLAWSPTPAAQANAYLAGYTLLRERTLLGLDARLVVLAAPSRMDTAVALRQLRALDPDGTYDFNHLYTGSGTRAAASSARSPSVGSTSSTRKSRIGLIDGGLDANHVALRKASVRYWGCEAKRIPSAHGTGVASLMVGKAGGFQGVAPNASLYAADVYCGMPTGGAVDSIVDALAWMAREKVGVLNVSLVGPANRTLEYAVRAMIARGHVIVAAVGNDGPAAPPLYPASYPGVVGVSAVDGQGRVLAEAARGQQVMFAAPGVNMVAASGAVPYLSVRGTSFAAPIVAALLAAQLDRPDAAGARNAIARLAQQAVRPTPQRDTETGYGIVGTAYRIDPAVSLLPAALPTNN